MLSITITFHLGRSAHDSERDLLISEHSRDKSINVWVFINSGIKPLGITRAATSYRPWWAKASYMLLERTPSSQFCWIPGHDKKRKRQIQARLSPFAPRCHIAPYSQAGWCWTKKEPIYRNMFSWPRNTCHWLYIKHRVWFVFPRKSSKAHAFNPIWTRKLSEISGTYENGKTKTHRFWANATFSLSWSVIRNSS